MSDPITKWGLSFICHPQTLAIQQIKHGDQDVPVDLARELLSEAGWAEVQQLQADLRLRKEGVSGDAA